MVGGVSGADDHYHRDSVETLVCGLHVWCEVYTAIAN